MLISKSIEVCPTPVFFSELSLSKLSFSKLSLSKLPPSEAFIPRTRIEKTFASVPQLQLVLQGFSLYTKQAKRKERLCILLSVVLGVSPIWTMILAAEKPGVIPPLVHITLFVCAIAVHFVGRRWSQLTNISSLRCELPQNLSNLLSRDMAKDAPVDARIDFSPICLRKKQIGKGPYSGRRGWKQVTFADPWLRLSGRFLDGTLFTITVIQKSVIRSGHKRGRSGKMKFKRKTKHKGGAAQLELKFSRKQYGAIKALQSEVERAVHLTMGASLSRLSVNERRLLVTIKIPRHVFFRPQAIYQTLAQMLLSAYQVLNLSKVLSKQSA